MANSPPSSDPTGGAQRGGPVPSFEKELLTGRGDGHRGLTGDTWNIFHIFTTAAVRLPQLLGARLLSRRDRLITGGSEKMKPRRRGGNSGIGGSVGGGGGTRPGSAGTSRRGQLRTRSCATTFCLTNVRGVCSRRVARASWVDIAKSLRTRARSPRSFAPRHGVQGGHAVRARVAAVRRVQPGGRVRIQIGSS